MTDEYVIVEVERVAADHGSVVTFEGRDENGREVTIVADHRPAQLIVRALEDGTGDPVHVACEPYQLLGGHWYG